MARPPLPRVYGHSSAPRRVERDRRFKSAFTVTLRDDDKVIEYNATTCGHAGEIIVQSPGVTWDFCLKCMHPICTKCAGIMAGTGECFAFEAQLLAREAKPWPPIEQMRKDAVPLDRRARDERQMSAARYEEIADEILAGVR